ncbi:MAG: phospholipase D family protein [Archangium sp.]
MRTTLVCLGALLFINCAATKRATRPAELAVAPAKAGPLAELSDSLAQRHGVDTSGFQLINHNEDALTWRLALIDSARGSLDVMTFLWWGDESGDLLLSHVIAAADRGVKVRLIVDDMTTIDDGKQTILRDVPNSALDAHPNIALRVFNPWSRRGAAGRAVEFVSDFERLNQRMHHKALIADGHAAIVGGRNLGNEYMGLNPTFNFRDLDVLAVGPAARDVSSVFDLFWNSGWVTPQNELDATGTVAMLDDRRAALLVSLAAAKSLEGFPIAPTDWTKELESLKSSLHAGTSRMATDVPDAEKVTHRLRDEVQQLWAAAEREVLITNAYVLPDDAAFERTARELKKDVRFVMLTNSLASTDAAGVHAHYTDWRERMLKAGVELFELKHDAKAMGDVTNTGSVKAGYFGLHAKAMVIDRRHVLIGSMNLDPRSWVHNTEMVMRIDCPALGEEVARVFEHDVKPANAWRVELDTAGAVQWVSGDEVRHEAPSREGGQFLDELFNHLLPADLF